MDSDKFITLAMVIFVTTAVLYLGYVFVHDLLTYNNDSQNTKIMREMEQKYAENISKKTDSNNLIKNGAKMLENGQINYAYINFKKATEIDPNYRDAWLYLGYVNLKGSECKNGLDALKTAAKLDPIYPKTYELLNIAYTQLGDDENAQKAKEKAKMLSASR